MKSLLLLALFSTPAHAGKLLWVDSSMLTSLDWKYDRDGCLDLRLGVDGKLYSQKYCSGQAIIADTMNSLLTSPQTRECVKREICRGHYCEREYGTRLEHYKLLLIVNDKNQIESMKPKRELGSCQ